MSFGGGYVGNSGDALKIRKYEEQRNKSSAEAAKAKETMAAEAAKSHMVNFSVSKNEVIENAFKAESVGLQTREQFSEKRANTEKQLDEENRLRAAAALAAELRDKDKKRKKMKKELGAKLSFADDELMDDQEEEFVPSKKTGRFSTFGKNQAVKCDFLPDRDREILERTEREKLKAVFLADQEKVKQEKLIITFSYWDGGGHRRQVEVLKGDTIGVFLGKGKDMLQKEFRELRHDNSMGLMYIKEDLILPHTATFYDFIINKVRGKSGPLFHFDVYEDIRVVGGADIEKEDSHAGKVVHRSWYEKNKHIFPASRWEMWDPLKDYGDYKIYNGEKGPD
uniref:FAM50A/XAP5 C-terminal domain-containing protein n=1 Tax=Mantoniella antarctica TaxID=81844 RepID=A0A7S0STR1_9CHLO|mmetsp:Transcript_37181/g.59716  ORF Transcript_37181/g.59716 Transcript_37181/m.59716 type:complete len:338 (-) Transcript_37181:813-1826(-)|eukprot:CAMPEP_0181364116 /NCGR_PEP_ID=MMETSP1106-20121128/9183_1 /TAXON_ID=81844 /ORGANISM="Mantoniella antarctica, Strain SL-175" /LENGTH=337 /DNA_ID=CAMNT_0023478745 /DNA_START=189 /DNA_END=1202 /DNA_ORIENTATION=+